MKEILERYYYAWFKSLDINTQMRIAEYYSKEMDDNTNIVNGFTDQSEKWVVENYSDHIKDYILITILKEFKTALQDVIPYAQQEAASLADVDEPELADKAWDVIDKANKLLI